MSEQKIPSILDETTNETVLSLDMSNQSRVVLTTANQYVDKNIVITDIEKVNVDQGTENSGKYLYVDNTGKVTPNDAPVTSVDNMTGAINLSNKYAPISHVGDSTHLTTEQINKLANLPFKHVNTNNTLTVSNLITLDTGLYYFDNYIAIPNVANGINNTDYGLYGAVAVENDERQVKFYSFDDYIMLYYLKEEDDWFYITPTSDMKLFCDISSFEEVMQIPETINMSGQNYRIYFVTENIDDYYTYGDYDFEVWIPSGNFIIATYNQDVYSLTTSYGDKYEMFYADDAWGIYPIAWHNQVLLNQEEDLDSSSYGSIIDAFSDYYATTAAIMEQPLDLYADGDKNFKVASVVGPCLISMDGTIKQGSMTYSPQRDLQNRCIWKAIDAEGYCHINLDNNLTDVDFAECLYALKSSKYFLDNPCECRISSENNAESFLRNYEFSGKIDVDIARKDFVEDGVSYSDTFILIQNPYISVFSNEETDSDDRVIWVEDNSTFDKFFSRSSASSLHISTENDIWELLLDTPAIAIVDEDITLYQELPEIDDAIEAYFPAGDRIHVVGNTVYSEFTQFKYSFDTRDNSWTVLSIQGVPTINVKGELNSLDVSSLYALMNDYGGEVIVYYPLNLYDEKSNLIKSLLGKCWFNVDQQQNQKSITQGFTYVPYLLQDNTVAWKVIDAEGRIHLSNLSINDLLELDAGNYFFEDSVSFNTSDANYATLSGAVSVKVYNDEIMYSAASNNVSYVWKGQKNDLGEPVFQIYNPFYVNNTYGILDDSNVSHINNNGTLEGSVASIIETLKSSISQIGSAFVLKGSKPTIDALPSTGNSIGDVYYVVSETAGYIWLDKNGSGDLGWEELGINSEITQEWVLSQGFYIKPADGIPYSDLPWINSFVQGKVYEITNNENFYVKPFYGIPQSDLNDSTSLKIDNAYSVYSNKISSGNLVTSTATGVTTGKAVYEFVNAVNHYSKPSDGIPLSDISAAAILGSASNVDSTATGLVNGKVLYDYVNQQITAFADTIQPDIDQIQQLISNLTYTTTNNDAGGVTVSIGIPVEGDE